MIKRLQIVIDYLEGRTEIYDGKHTDVLATWNDAWDEMKYLGYNPETAEGIRRYIKKELA